MSRGCEQNLGLCSAEILSAAPIQYKEKHTGQHKFEMAQPDSENNSGTFPAEMRDLQSEIGIAHKCKIAPLRAKKKS